MFIYLLYSYIITTRGMTPKYMEGWHYCYAIILLLGLLNSSYGSGSGDENNSTIILPLPSTSLTTSYTKTTLSPRFSLMITPTRTAGDVQTGLKPEVATGIIIGILVIVLILLVCIIVVASYIIRMRKNHTQLMEVST